MRKQKGLSLVELMISLTLGIVLMTGVIQMFLTSRMTYANQQAISRIQESGRLAVDFLAQDIRMAGYMGCSSRNPSIVNGLEASTSYLYNLNEVVRGFQVGDDDDIDALHSELPENSDVLLIRRASSNSTSLVDLDVSGTNANIRISDAPVDDCLFGGSLCSGDLAIMSDCAQGRLFRAVNVGDVGGGTIGEGQIVHSQGGGGSVPKNVDSKLGEQNFEPGTEILAFNSIVFYVAPSSFQPENGAEVRSLWTKVGERDAVELIEGVERIRIEFGVDSDGDSIPDDYDWTENVSSWENVQAARVHLLIQGAADGVLPDSQSLSYAGEDITFNDGRMRQVFTTTVGIRSRLN